MDKDIERLLRRFMDGLTTVEEESRIAEYFRTHEVDAEWKAYKDMFAWFDDGMPLQAGEGRHAKTGGRRARIIAMAMAVAAAIAALIIMTGVGRTGDAAVGETADMAQSSAAEPGEDTPVMKDSLAADSVKTEEAKKPLRRRGKPRRRVYEMKPPKTYLAQSERDSVNAVAKQMVEEKLWQMSEEQEHSLRELYQLCEKQDQEIELIATFKDGVDYETEATETEEENEYY